MGCGFSSGEITKAADDEERILNSSSTELQQDMGAGQSKQKSKQKNNKKKNGVNNGSGISDLVDNNKTNNGKNNNGRKVSTGGGFHSSSASPFNIQSTEVSSSQVNFFKMLDEKIENGIELEQEQDSEHERHLKLQRVSEEWDNLLGRSQDSSTDNVEKIIDEASKATRLESNASSSVDSMKTMFSNSVTLPAGTLREAVANNKEAASSKNRGLTRQRSSGSGSGSSAGSGGRPISAIGKRTVNNDQ